MALTAFFIALRAAGLPVSDVGRARRSSRCCFPFATGNRLWPARRWPCSPPSPCGRASHSHCTGCADATCDGASPGTPAHSPATCCDPGLRAGRGRRRGRRHAVPAPAPPRAALPRWLADLAVTAVGSSVRASIPTEPADASVWDDNARELVNQVPTLLARAAWPFGDATAPVLIVLAATFGSGCGVAAPRWTTFAGATQRAAARARRPRPHRGRRRDAIVRRPRVHRARRRLREPHQRVHRVRHRAPPRRGRRHRGVLATEHCAPPPRARRGTRRRGPRAAARRDRLARRLPRSDGDWRREGRAARAIGGLLAALPQRRRTARPST